MSPTEQRAQRVVKEIDEIIQDVMPKLIRLGHLRKELALLTQEAEKDEQAEP